jgi:hypothetical protein
LRIADFERLVGSETAWAEKKRIYREEQKRLKIEEASGQSADNVLDNFQQDIDIRDRDKEIEIDIDNIYTSGALEPSTPPKDDIFIKFPLISKELYAITATDVGTWQELYPAVDVKQELRKMAGWLDANPKNRKTINGIKKFIVNWLSREQDRAKAEKPTRPKGKVKTDEYSQEQLGSVFYTGN